MVILTTWAKIYSTEFFCNAKVARLGKLFLSRENFWLYGMSLVHVCISLAGHSLLPPFLLSDKRDWTVRLEIYEDIQLKFYTLNKLVNTHAHIHM